MCKEQPQYAGQRADILFFLSAGKGSGGSRYAESFTAYRVRVRILQTAAVKRNLHVIQFDTSPYSPIFSLS